MSTCTFGSVELQESVVGYRVYQPGSKKPPSEHDLRDKYSHTLRTKGLTIELDLELFHRLDNLPSSNGDGQSVRDALHGLEHLLLALIPTVALCDRRDLAGHFVEGFKFRATGQLSIYDAYEGGIGYAAIAFSKIDTLLEQAYDVITGCPCTAGCPQCIHAGWCIWENKALDKAATRELLRLLLIRP